MKNEDATDDVHTDLLALARELVADERDPVANAANLAALVYERLPELNWAGFYFVRDGMLTLGPFQGKTAVTRIARGSGVCGEAWNRGETLVVDDVHAFAGHIACDAASNAEIVVPFAVAGHVRGVLDLDSPVHARFTAADRATLEALCELYVEASDFF